MIKVKAVRLDSSVLDPRTTKNMTKWHFYGLLPSGNEIRLYVLDEDKPVPPEYEEVDITEGKAILEVTFFRKLDDVEQPSSVPIPSSLR